tara:strand:+ start:184 stop:471 length:288 start_codon:yes stop_codon:yes gene_type:complete
MNVQVFAYGATGSGKTHTMIGNHSAGPGVMVLAMRDLYEAMELSKNDDKGNPLSYKLEMTYMEIYNEHIRDLLVPDSPNLDMQQNGKGEIQVSLS